AFPLSAPIWHIPSLVPLRHPGKNILIRPSSCTFVVFVTYKELPRSLPGFFFLMQDPALLSCFAHSLVSRTILD
ncbi:unnamed protein product, partial [Sphenostylis stenocarpa]